MPGALDSDPFVMKKRLTTVLVATLALSVTAQDPANEDVMQARLKKKLASEFLGKANWFTDFDKAKAEAKKTKKVLFGYFTRSFMP